MSISTSFFEQSAPSQKICNWACLIYLSGLSSFIIPLGNLIVPLVIWLIKKEDHVFIDSHGKEVLNFQMTLWLVTILFGLICVGLAGFLFSFHFITALLHAIPMALLIASLTSILAIVNIIFMIVGAMKAYNGKPFNLPLKFSFIK